MFALLFSLINRFSKYFFHSMYQVASSAPLHWLLGTSNEKTYRNIVCINGHWRLGIHSSGHGSLTSISATCDSYMKYIKIISGLARPFLTQEITRKHIYTHVK